jgi:hypothetical protein
MCTFHTHYFLESNTVAVTSPFTQLFPTPTFAIVTPAPVKKKFWAQAKINLEILRIPIRELAVKEYKSFRIYNG